MASSTLDIAKREFLSTLEAFKAGAELSAEELQDFQFTSLEDLQVTVNTIQQKQAQTKRLLYMRRLEPFLKTMGEYGKVIEVFVNTSEILAFIWGPMKYLLLVASTFSEALNALLDTYEQIGEQIPLLIRYQTIFSDNSHMRSILVMIYGDILNFHKEALKHFKHRLWKQLFQATWRGFLSKIESLKDNLRRHRQLIESRATIVEFEEVQSLRRLAETEFQERKYADLARRRKAVFQWLSPANSESIHERHVTTWSSYPNSGRWLLNDHRFQKWFDPVFCSTPLLWLSGKPGAGKTVLASLIVEEARKIPGISVAFFYCAQDDARDNFISVARGILSQLLAQDETILLHLDEKMSMKSGEAVLSSSVLAKEMLQVVLKSRKTYIILDGLDECNRDQRKEICTWFRSVVDSLPRTKMDEIRCLFISQDDGIARKDLSVLPSIKITAEDNKSDIEMFAKDWQRRIEDRFGPLDSAEHNIANIITPRSQGMFIFAKLVLENLYQQPSRRCLLEECHAGNFPQELDDVYDRILKRVLNCGPESRRTNTLKLLTWISCSKRPLRWFEIQGAVSIDLENQTINDEDRLIDDSKDLCASLVEVRSDETVELVHSTVKEFLIRKKIVKPVDTDYELAMLNVAYLCFPDIDSKLESSAIETALLAGSYSFYEYAVTCWVLHLLSWLPGPAGEEQTRDLAENLEVFLDLHYSHSGGKHTVTRTMHDKLQALGSFEFYDSLAQAVVSARKQFAIDRKEASDAESPAFSANTAQIRSTFERAIATGLSPELKANLKRYYGENWFKCPRINCQYFYRGFRKREDRDRHLDRHDRAYTCNFEGCPTATFGCISKKELEKHMLEYHGIANDTLEFPDLPDPNTRRVQKHPATFQCTLCPKRFTRAYNLRSHLRTHTDERPFVCAVCGKAFARQHDRKRHESLHSKVKKPTQG